MAPNTRLQIALVAFGALLAAQTAVGYFLRRQAAHRRRIRMMMLSILDSMPQREGGRVVRRRRRPRNWVNPGRSSEWWDNIRKGRTAASEWKDNFRMSRESFYKLCGLLQQQLQKEDTRLRSATSVETQVAATLYYLSDAGGLQKTADAFGLGKSTVSHTVRRVCRVIVSELGPELIKLPFEAEEVRELAAGFRRDHGLPQCVGLIDCTHVEIKAPSESSTAYINSRQKHSMNVQAVCDSRCRFYDVVVRWPGSAHDSRIFVDSNINKALQNGEIPPCPREIIPDREAVPVYLIGDLAYPLLPYVMKECTGGGSTAQEQYFSLKLCSARAVIGRAFGRLKARFRILRKPVDVNIDDLPYVIYACFVLHNFCELNQEHVPEQLVSAAMDYDREQQPADASVPDVHDETEGKRFRQLLTEFVGQCKLAD